MDREFLNLMKEVAKSYNITIEENAPEGGVFYCDADGTARKLTDEENSNIIDDFYVEADIRNTNK